LLLLSSLVLKRIRLEKNVALLHGTEDDMLAADQPTDLFLEGVVLLCLVEPIGLKKLSINLKGTQQIM
jgi:hypothetical protein